MGGNNTVDAKAASFEGIPSQNTSAGKCEPRIANDNLAGLQKNCAFGGDPVNMSTGNFIYSKVDIEIPGQYPLSFKRFYNALCESDGVLAAGWTHNFNIKLCIDGESVVVTFDDGHAETYQKSEGCSYTAPSGCKNILLRTDSGWSLSLHSREQYCFDNKGALTSVTDKNGNVAQYYYTCELLARVTNACGSLSFTYNEKRRLTRVTDHAGRQVKLAYSRNKLVKVVHPSGAVYQYEYDDRGLLSKLINPALVETIQNAFDKNGRTLKQRFADGGVYALSYDDDKLTTTITEQNGNKIRYERDEKSRTQRTIYADSEERFEYNEKDERVLYADRNGNVRRYEYDSGGNMTKETDPLGNETELSYNSTNALTRIRRADSGELEFEYDARSNLIKYVDPLQRVTDFSYDGRGLVTCLTMPDGSKNKISYDTRGNIICIMEPSGKQSKYEYDDLNRVIKTVDGKGNATRFEYNSSGGIIKVTNSKGDARLYEYTVTGKVRKIIDFDGSEINYRYNKLDKVEEVIDQMGGSTVFAYDKMWNVTAITDPNGNTIKYSYNNQNRLVSVTDAEGNETCYEHDAKGNVTVVTAPNGAITELSYDAMDRAIEIKEADDAVTKYEYDCVGNMIKMTDPQGRETRQEFDQADQLLKKTDPLGNSTLFTYTPMGQVETVIDAKGGTVKYEYHAGGLLKRIILPEGENESYEYDNNGNVIKVTDGLGKSTSLEYDALNRVIAVIDALGQVKRFTYDAAGNITEAINESGNSTKYKYSLLGDIVEVIDALGHSTKYEYDKARRLSKVEQYRLIDDTLADVKEIETQTTTYERNKNGDVTAIKSPLERAVYFKYDSMGNVISKLDEDDLETLYEYNLVNKLSKVTYADGKTVEFSYSPLKQLVLMKDWLGITTVTTDILGRIEQVTDFEGKTVQYQWDELSRREKTVYPDLSEVQYKYNRSGRLESVVSDSGETKYKYDALGRATEKNMPGGISVRREFNPLGRLSSLTNMKDGAVTDRFDYRYDPVGNITRINKNRKDVPVDNGLFEYGYDPLGRLITANGGGKSKEYTYDNLGNRLGSLENGREIRHHYNTLNQLVSTHDADVVTGYRYDRRGNLTEVIKNDILQASYVYDATNMMQSAFNAEKGAATYTYDGFRNRVKRLEQFESPKTLLAGKLQKNDPCNEIRFILDMTLPYNNLLMTEGSENQRFIWGNELLASEGSDDFFYMHDHLGSPIRLVDCERGGSSNYNWSTPLAYDEFGVSLAEGENMYNPFGFTGYQTDSISGLYYAHARYYAPEIGRFAARDILKGVPILPTTLNEYSYCTNNPVIYEDRDGEFLNLAAGLIGAAAGALIGGAASAITQVASGKSLKELDWRDIGRSAATGAVIGGLAGVTMGAAVALLPAAATAVGIGTSMFVGCSGAVATTVTTAATVAGGAAIGAFGLCTVSNIIEAGTMGYGSQVPCLDGGSYNPVRDTVLGGDQDLYDSMYMASAITTGGIIATGAANAALKPPPGNTAAASTGGAGNGTYQAPAGGGGVTNTINTGNGTVTFGHGGNHFPGANVSTIEQTIANNVPQLGVGQNYTGVVNVNGVNIEFRAFGVSEGVTNVGTYFPLP